MLRWRLLGAAAILLPLLTLIYLDFAFPLDRPGVWLLPVALLVAMLAAEEVLSLLAAQQLRPVPTIVYGGTLLVILAAAAPLFYSLAGLSYPAACPLGQLGVTLGAFTLCVPLCFGGEMLRYEKPAGVIVNVALALFAIAYVGLSLAMLVHLRYLPGASSQLSLAAAVSVIWIVKFADTGAYLFGKTFGRTKFTPKLSPNKTVEGALGGVLTAVLAAGVYFHWLMPWALQLETPLGTWRGWLLYAVIVAAAGMVGDLAESLLKRDMGQKDSSSWLRGLGGVLDVIDSVLIAAPVAYLCWAGGLLRV